MSQLKYFDQATGQWVPVSSLGGGAPADLLSALTSAEVPVTGATAAAFGRMHVCSGTAADYTVTLPAATNNAGKLIGVRMATGLTKLVTIDAGAGSLIDGQQTRIMWANEVAILLCDGTNWTKIAGKHVPIAAQLDLIPTVNVAISNLTVTKLNLNSNSTFTNMAAMVDTAAGKITVKRPALYFVHCDIAGWTGGTANNSLQTRVNKNGALFDSVSGGYFYSPEATTKTEFNKPLSLAVGDYIELYCYRNGAGSLYLFGDGSAKTAYLQLLEIPVW